jgi:peptide/nickel transport system permease protein
VAEPVLTPAKPGAAASALAPRAETMSQIVWKRLRRRKPALIGLGVLVVIVLLAVFAPLVTSGNAEAPNLLFKFAKPLSRTADGHLLIFGGDNLGRDVFARSLYGARVSLEVGFLASGLSLVLGVIIGAVAGYYGGWIDNLLMRVVDIFLSIPSLLLMITIVAIYSSTIHKGQEIYLIIGVVGILGWPGPARLVRGEFLTLKERDFVEAAKALGSRDGRIIFRHILPNVLGPVIVSATLAVSGAILTEATLSYLGLGIQPPIPSWGNMIQDGQSYLRNAWWITTFPGALACLATLSLYMLGDGLREALDPRLKNR